jgi:hypothetical protein
MILIHDVDCFDAAAWRNRSRLVGAWNWLRALSFSPGLRPFPGLRPSLWSRATLGLDAAPRRDRNSAARRSVMVMNRRGKSRQCETAA